MKRMRSYGEEIDDGISEKPVCKNWSRRDDDPDRLSSQRRFYPKAENGWKGLSSLNDRSKRFELDSEGFDRRKGFDRYRDWSDRAGPSISSPRSFYSRSESFSLSSRREFPKGFRSERDRARWDERVSAWRKSVSNGKDADEDRIDSGRGSRVGSEDRGSVKSASESRDVGKSPIRSKDSGGEQSVELKKMEDGQGNSGDSSEMEEGELEPDPEPDLTCKPQQEPELEAGLEPSKVVDLWEESNILETDMAGETKPLCEWKLGHDERGVLCGKEEVGVLVMERDTMEDSDRSQVHQDSFSSESDAFGDGAEANIVGEKEDSLEAEDMPLPSQDPQPELRREEELIEEMSFEKPPPLEEDLKEEKEIRIDNDRKPPPSQKEQKEEKGIDLEVPAVAEAVGLINSTKDDVDDNMPDVTVKFVNKLQASIKDKGKNLAVSPSDEGNFAKDSRWMTSDLLTSRHNAMEGPCNRGFELFFHSDVMRPEKAKQSGIDQHKDENLEMEPLDLALGLPNADKHDSKQPPNSPLQEAPNSQSWGRSFHPLANSFCTSSDGFTASISVSGSQLFVHNPSCSLTQNSFENYEHSVVSHPRFQGVDHFSHGTWRGQSSDEPKCSVPLYQRILLNGNGNGTGHPSHASQGAGNLQGAQGQDFLKVVKGSVGMRSGLDRQLSISRQFSGQLRRDELRSPSHCVGSCETKLGQIKDKKQGMQENGSGISRTSPKELEELILTDVAVVERIISKIISEPIQVMARRIQEMTEQSILYMKECVFEMIRNKGKHGQLHVLQEALQRRSDITLGTLTNCHRVQLEILVALKTGLLDFVLSGNNVPSSDLVEILLNLKCRNLACGSILPVDECGCKICAQKNGFCSACMCMLCSKFDMASNTCSWVGCDICLHWCHTDCGLRDLHIRNGPALNNVHGETEMQFHCVACGHPSEMLGFVKEVFKTCAREWTADNMSKELGFLRKIFCSSDDRRGKQLGELASRLVGMLENKLNLPEVYKLIMEFLTEIDSKLGSTSLVGLSQKNLVEGSNQMIGPSQEALRTRSVSAEKVPYVENSTSMSPSLDLDQMGRRTEVPKLHLNTDRKPVLDELESIVRIKQAEAKMFQTRADDARREAEGLKCIAVAKNDKIEEEYVNRITKLHLAEADERRQQKVEELQGLERSHHEYFNMKMRMESDVKYLLLKMEATKRELTT